MRFLSTLLALVAVQPAWGAAAAKVSEEEAPMPPPPSATPSHWAPRAYHRRTL